MLTAITAITGFSRKLTLLKGIVLAVLLIIAGFIMTTLCVGKLIFENTTTSAPTGIYVRTLSQKLEPGDFVVVTLPDDYPALHVQKGFPMLKQVRGFPGDTYVVSGTSLIFKGRVFPSAPFIPQFNYLPRLKDGIYKVPEGTHLYLNDVHSSFDSRYLGPISDDHMKTRVALLFSYADLDKLTAKIVPDSWAQKKSVDTNEKH